MKLLKRQNFVVGDQDCCAAIYGYEMPNNSKELFAVSIVGVSNDNQQTLFVNRSIKSRADAEKIFNAEVDKIKR